jgi:hypothetical protein
MRYIHKMNYRWSFVFILSSFSLYCLLYLIIHNEPDYLTRKLWQIESTLEQSFEDFFLNPNYSVCGFSQNKFTFITFVAIAPDRFQKRKLIRSTYGRKNTDFRVVFTVGMSRNQTVNTLIVEEFLLYKDIIQIKNFYDSYSNLTYKIMKSFRWIENYCKNAKYVLRINDDVVVNTFELVNYFKNLKYSHNSMFGFVYYNARPFRNKDSKFYISEQQYKKSTYPPYIEGILKYSMLF